MSLRRKLMMRLGAQMMARVELGEEPQVLVEDYVSGGYGLTEIPSEMRSQISSGEIANQLRARASVAFEWARNGWPALVPSHRLAASLMATAVPPEVATDIAMPWNCFAIALSPGLFPITEAKSIEHMVVQVADSGAFGISMQPESDDPPFSAAFSSLADCCLVIDRGRPEDFGRRLCTLAGRLVLGLCIELDKPKHRLVIGEGRPKERREKRGEPKAWTFQLTRDVKVDCREWVRDFIRGGTGTSPSVQTLVRGHHRRQPCGPGGRDRKWIHVEPYWRGPDDAPIAVRSHRVSGRAADVAAQAEGGAS